MAKSAKFEPFTSPPDDPLAAEHAAVAKLAEEALSWLKEHGYSQPLDIESLSGAESLLDSEPEQARRYVLAAVAQARYWRRLDYQNVARFYAQAAHLGTNSPAGSAPADLLDLIAKHTTSALSDVSERARVADAIIIALMQRQPLPFQGCDLLVILEWGNRIGPFENYRQTVRALQTFGTEGAFDVELQNAVRKFAAQLRCFNSRVFRRMGVTLSRLIGNGSQDFLVPGEAWSDAINAELSALETEQQRSWAELFRHAFTATASRPSRKWLKTADELVGRLGSDRVRDAFTRWLPWVAQTDTSGRLESHGGAVFASAGLMDEENAECLRGLLWMAPRLPRHDELARDIVSLALWAYKKIPGVGPRVVKVGNAAVYALSEMPSPETVAHLALLKIRVKSALGQTAIEKAFNKAAMALALPRDEIEEMGVPTYGMDEIGRRTETFGDSRAELVVDGSRTALHWFDAHGKAMKSVPAKVKNEHKDDLKELQQALKDVQKMLPAQRDRIESLFAASRVWPLESWRSRYLDHPLVGTIARRLIWQFSTAGHHATGAWHDGQFADAEGALLPTFDAETKVELWHPAGKIAAEVLAWRGCLERCQIQQPFKQAHREIYLLTEAERSTETYSNRFAGHILRQGQFRALASARGWATKFLGPWDGGDMCIATRRLDPCGIRAEFWVNAAPDSVEEGAGFRHVATDQVRFYAPCDAREPLRLEQVPSLVFSEIMRDVDLFVGVASVGNDPTWQDGGPEGRYRDYWQSYSFGELSATAATRKEVLEHLVPRLTIADRCAFSDRFLVVRGEKRVYKIHLGSGNILMEPNDQYLCIVPDARSLSQGEKLFLPFEGDNTLSIIISKALLLAEDCKIKDPTIVRQIEHR